MSHVFSLSSIGNEPTDGAIFWATPKGKREGGTDAAQIEADLVGATADG